MASAKASPPGAQATKPLDVREAVAIALDYFRHIFPEQAHDNLMLEEVEESEDGKYWLVTVGYDVRKPSRLAAFAPEFSRAYKTLKVDSSTRRVVSVKIRTLA